MYTIWQKEHLMPKEWIEAYSLHNETIDTQHKELFNLANKVEALDSKTASKEQLGILLKEFFNYMKEHFKDEEAYMQSIDYPIMNQHCKLHESIIEQMTLTLKLSKGIEVLQAKIKEVSHQWLVEHILKHDLKIEKWRKGISVEPNELHTIT